MQILVQKFGGTSLSTAQAREHAIRHIQNALQLGYKLVVTVSAMGRKGDPFATDTLLDWIAQNGNHLPAREKDMLLCCGEIISAATLCSLLNARSIPSVVLSGGQAGILTNEHFGNAHIISVQPDKIRELLEKDLVVIVAGFQGRTMQGDMTTLGRGGSDTTATALGAALKSEYVDIFTDVNGVLTADPRIVEEAKPLFEVTYGEICNMAYHGAKVIHPRAVEIAMQAGIPIRVRSTFSDDEGTLVTSSDNLKQQHPRILDKFVTGIAYVSKVSQIRLFSAAGQYDLHLKVFKAMAENQISVDFINVNPSGVVYTVFDTEAEKAARILHEMGCEPEISSDCAKVSVIGGGMNGVPGIMARIVEALTDEDIPILQSADSNTTIWVLVAHENMARAVRALHRKFQLHEEHVS